MTQPDFEKWLPFMSAQGRQACEASSIGGGCRRPLTITISRQSGCGALHIANGLADLLQHGSDCFAAPWLVYDRNLVQQVLQDHGLSARLDRYMPEDVVPDLADVFDELFGLHPPAWTLVQQTTETILRLANRGHVILIGRGAHIITRRLDHVFRVRLVGSLSRRIEHYRQSRGIDRVEALARIRLEDRGRRRYLKRYFGQDVDDTLAYDLVLNTDSLPYERSARLISEAALEHARNRRAMMEPGLVPCASDSRANY